MKKELKDRLTGDRDPNIGGWNAYGDLEAELYRWRTQTVPSMFGSVDFEATANREAVWNQDASRLKAGGDLLNALGGLSAYAQEMHSHGTVSPQALGDRLNKVVSHMVDYLALVETRLYGLSMLEAERGMKEGKVENLPTEELIEELERRLNVVVERTPDLCELGD